MSILCNFVHWEAFTVIVYVLLLSLTIWRCSLLIMIISKSLSCLVHLCNNVSECRTQDMRLFHTHFPHFHQQTKCVKCVLYENLNNFYTSKTQNELCFICKSVLLYSLLCGWISTTGTMDKISQYFYLYTNWLSMGRNCCNKAAFDSAIG